MDHDARDLLAAAALLHDVGYVVGYRRHHKHSYRLIANAQLDGFTPREREVIALTARYHRRSAPSKRHRAWATLARADRDLVRRLSAILRIADALDRRHSQGVRDVRCRVTRHRVHLILIASRELAVELHAAEAKAGLFRNVFGRALTVKAIRMAAASRAAASARPLRLLRRASA